MLDWLFKTRTSLECCLCGEIVRVAEDESVCPQCNDQISNSYRLFHEEAKPFYVPVVGWSSVGKTVWLLALTRRMRELGATIWPEFAAICGSEITKEYQQIAEQHIRTRQVPGATPLGVQQAYVQILRKMPLWGGRTFVIRDCGGENFESTSVQDDKQIPFLKKSRTTFFFLSYPNIWADERISADDLLDCYLTTLMKHCKQLRQERRKIVVVLSKADEMQGKLPDQVHHYLLNDPMIPLAKEARVEDFSATQMCEYLERMKAVSDVIRDWLSTMRDGKQFINIAREFNIELRFSAISALGSPASNGALQKPWEPYRVLDPFFWALEFHSAPSGSPIPG